MPAGPLQVDPNNTLNPRANIWALKQLGVTHVVAATACGSLKVDTVLHILYFENFREILLTALTYIKPLPCVGGPPARHLRGAGLLPGPDPGPAPDLPRGGRGGPARGVPRAHGARLLYQDQTGDVNMRR